MQVPVKPIVAILYLIASLSFAQVPPAPPTPSTLPTPSALSTPAAPAPPSPVSGIRNKISAGDLLSAESILEVHKAKNGEDGQWLLGLSWLARGALLLGDTAKARIYTAKTRTECAKRVAQGKSLDQDHELEIAYGAAIETEAQRLERVGNTRQAADFLRGELKRITGPVALISRINKRLNMMTIVGEKAPEIEIEDYLGEKPPSLSSFLGRPVLLFLWSESCGDCKAQASSLARVRSTYQDSGLQLATLTRFYDDSLSHAQEKAKIDSVWKAVYPNVGTVPMYISTASMERYGVSSTPTFVFIDRAGIIRRYTPTRLTEEEMSRSVEALLR